MVAEPADLDRTLTAVVVDDDRDARRLIGALASGAGVEVVAATETVIEAVLLTARHHPDIVVINELTHDVDAGQAARALRTTRPGLFVVGLCAHPDRTSPAWANVVLDRTKLDDLPVILGAAERMIEQERRLLEVQAKLDASRGLLDIVRREWGSLNHDRTRKLVDELAQGLDRLRTGLDGIHEAMRGEATLVQVVRPQPVATTERGPRPRLAEVKIDHLRDEVSARVVLEAGDKNLIGRSSRGVGERPAYPPVAEAILDAVSELLEEDIDVRDFDVIRVGQTSLAVVLFKREDDTLVGSARVREEVTEAVARASLDGLNRFITRSLAPAEIRL
ncbi:MAG: response regulator [Actinobacteria bacterium]|nr:response regulator [Actinomycetota bacterium]